MALYLKKLESPSLKDALYQVLLILDQWSWRRRRKYEKFTKTPTLTTTTATTTDNGQIVISKVPLNLLLR